ncbi:MAG TPA: hypothetical protein VFH80_22725 [Solirubrobacteraceae bacterium]|nr:hypothetical protein [Solirubrobacteraceae bacterium]
MATATDRPRTPDVTRFEAGAVLVAAGAVVLLISLFFDWYEPGRSAWQVFEVWDLVLAALALTALWAAAERAWSTRPLPQRWLLVPGIAALVIVVESLVNHPPAAIGSGPMVGIWLALGASMAMAIGAGMSIARVSVAIHISDGASSAHREPGTWSQMLRSRFRGDGRRSHPAAGPDADGASPPAAASGGAASARSASQDERPTEETRVLGEHRRAAPPSA